MSESVCPCFAVCQQVFTNSQSTVNGIHWLWYQLVYKLLYKAFDMQALQYTGQNLWAVI